MKKKKQEYLPIKWVRFGNSMKPNLNKTDDVYGFCCFLRKTLTYYETQQSDDIQYLDVLLTKFKNTYPTIGYLKDQLDNVDYNSVNETVNRIKSILSRWSIYYFMKLWSYNKQVFKFDNDFINELLMSESAVIPKTCLEHLPYNMMYIDLSEYEDISNTLHCKGIFLDVIHYQFINKDAYVIKTIRVSENYHISNTCIVSEDITLDEINKLDDYHEIKVYDKYQNVETLIDSYQFLCKVVLSILSYLSSPNADIIESNATIHTYVKPLETAIPKDMWREVRQWDVGIRIGTSVRDWKKKNKTRSSNTIVTETGKTVRPHLRRAHWHRYYYKTSNGGKELRPVWLHPIFVNERSINSDDEVPVTIHETSLFD